MKLGIRDSPYELFIKDKQTRVRVSFEIQLLKGFQIGCSKHKLWKGQILREGSRGLAATGVIIYLFYSSINMRAGSVETTIWNNSLFIDFII